MKTYRQLTLEERKQTYENWKQFCKEAKIVPIDNFEDYDKEEWKYNCKYDEFNGFCC